MRIKFKQSHIRLNLKHATDNVIIDGQNTGLYAVRNEKGEIDIYPSSIPTFPSFIAQSKKYAKWYVYHYYYGDIKIEICNLGQ